MSSNSLDAQVSLGRLRFFSGTSYALWLVTAAVIFAFGNDRHDWFLLICWTLSFPFSALADEHAILLRYHPRFAMLFGRTPWMIPFAFGAFFTLPFLPVWHLGLLDDFSFGIQAVIVLLVGTAWSTFVELSSSSSGMYRYRWPERWLVAGTPWPIPIIDGVVYLLTYLGHAYLVKATEGWGHLAAFGLSYAVYVGMFVAFAIFNGVVIRGLLRIQPVDRL